jgi:hypothetical protein
MAVLNLWAPDAPGIWTGPSTSGSAFFTNPWSTQQNPACDVWIQLTAGMAYVDDSPYYIGFGIFVVESIGSGGIQQQIFADLSDIGDVSFPEVPVILFVPQLLSFTVGWTAPSYYGCVYPTLIQWG